ncbi:hypothetical protein [Thalassotalea castellviae]|uniref:Transposase n=1 Tax=Thalassotalea castellviae TaxID=3075612 RepID=A0ABU3A1S5_9GAMM|nr:hypothetical protein [Thalassotalea sp. W431]MDT0602911.1 hypothetical protein [Thalassotalea sp. W431]
MSNWQQHQVVLQYGKVANAFKKLTCLLNHLQRVAITKAMAITSLNRKNFEKYTS